MGVAYKGMLADNATGKVATGKVFLGASFSHFPFPLDYRFLTSLLSHFVKTKSRTAGGSD